jgi:hypothetical protein
VNLHKEWCLNVSTKYSKPSSNVGDMFLKSGTFTEYALDELTIVRDYGDTVTQPYKVKVNKQKKS